MLKKALLGLIEFYRKGVSPITPPACRFTPSCSEYAATAIERYGAGWGSVLAARRLLRCHPFGGRGYDPVPPASARGSEPHEAYDAAARQLPAREPVRYVGRGRGES